MTSLEEAEWTFPMSDLELRAVRFAGLIEQRSMARIKATLRQAAIESGFPESAAEEILMDPMLLLAIKTAIACTSTETIKVMGGQT